MDTLLSHEAMGKDLWNGSEVTQLTWEGHVTDRNNMEDIVRLNFIHTTNIHPEAFPLRRQGRQSLLKILCEEKFCIRKRKLQYYKNIKKCFNHKLFLKKHCPTATPAGKVTAGVHISLASPEPIEF